MAEKEKPKIYEKLYKSSVESEKDIKIAALETKLQFDEASTQTRRELEKKFGKEGLLMNKIDQKNYAVDTLSQKLFDLTAPKLREKLGMKEGTEIDPNYKPDEKFLNEIIRTYHGVTKQSLSTIMDAYEGEFSRGYIEEIQPKHMNRLKQEWSSGAHEHLKKADYKHREDLAKHILGADVDKRAITYLANDSNVVELGSMVHKHKTDGSLSKDYLKQAHPEVYKVIKK